MPIFRRRCSASGAAEDAERRAGFDREVNILEILLRFVVSEAHVLKDYVARHIGVGRTFAVVLFIRRHYLVDTLDRNARLAHLFAL